MASLDGIYALLRDTRSNIVQDKDELLSINSELNILVKDSYGDARGKTPEYYGASEETRLRFKAVVRNAGIIQQSLQHLRMAVTTASERFLALKEHVKSGYIEFDEYEDEYKDDE